jgi:hypothetical protein
VIGFVSSILVLYGQVRMSKYDFING